MSKEIKEAKETVTTKKKAENSGQFKKGNKIGEKTRFKKDNQAAVKYKGEYCEMIIDYFAKPAFQVGKKREFDKYGNVKSETDVVLAIEYPTLEGFANDVLKVQSETLRAWCDKYPRFKDAYARARELQFRILATNALNGTYNPLFAKFLAMNTHGMKEKQETDTTFKFEVSKEISDEAD